MKQELIKKEKGTINSTQDSVKNQLQFSENHQIYKDTSLELVKKLLKLLYSDLTLVTNELEYKRISQYIHLLKRINNCILKDPRYPHQLVQKIIDETYGGINKDSRIIGAKPHLIFNEIKNNLKNYIPYVEPIFTK